MATTAMPQTAPARFHRMSTQACSSAHSGFTLFEIMVAVAIVGTALTMATLAMGQNYKLKDKIQKTMAADLIARNMMDVYRTASTPKKVPTDKTGLATMGPYTFRFQQIVTPAAMDGLKKVDILVYDRDNETALRTLSMFAAVK